MGLGSFNDFDWNFGEDTYSDSGFDWGSVWGDIGQDGSTWDWLNDIDGGDGGEGGGWLSTAGGWLSNFFGGGGNNSGNIYEGILGGLNGAAQAYMDKEAVEEAGKQQRKTLDFKAALEDYYAQKNKVRKRAALDTYGQFSTLHRWAPNAQPAPAIDMPSKPGY